MFLSKAKQVKSLMYNIITFFSVRKIIKYTYIKYSGRILTQGGL